MPQIVAKDEAKNNLDGYTTQFCGSAVPEHGFYFIEDTPAVVNERDLTTLAIIEVQQGEISAKQIEGEFKTLAGEGSTWRWYAKKIDGKVYR